jgi:hypothetical protein
MEPPVQAPQPLYLPSINSMAQVYRLPRRNGLMA